MLLIIYKNNKMMEEKYQEKRTVTQPLFKAFTLEDFKQEPTHVTVKTVDEEIEEGNCNENATPSSAIEEAKRHNPFFDKKKQVLKPKTKNPFSKHIDKVEVAPPLKRKAVSNPFGLKEAKKT